MEIAAGVISDQIERAIDMYIIAQESDAYEPYLDGYGFYKAGAAVYETHGSSLKETNPEQADLIETALNMLKSAYPSAAQPETLDENSATLRAAASRLLLSL